MSQENDNKMDVFEGLNPEVKVRTKKMMMWLVIFAIVMVFAGITSAMIVLYGSLIWLKITPPSILWVSNALVIASSITMYLSLKSVRSGNKSGAMTMLVVTFLLGLGFVYTQNAGWKVLQNMGMGATQSLNDQGLTVTKWNTLDRLTGTYDKDYFVEYQGERVVKVGEEYYKASDTGHLNPVTRELNGTFNAGGAMLSILIYLHIAHLFFGLIYTLVNLVRIQRGRIHRENWISLYAGGMYWHFMGILWLYLFAFTFFIF